MIIRKTQKTFLRVDADSITRTHRVVRSTWWFLFIPIYQSEYLL